MLRGILENLQGALDLICSLLYRTTQMMLRHKLLDTTRDPPLAIRKYNTLRGTRTRLCVQE